MRTLPLIFILVFSYSCKNIQKQDKQPPLDHHLVTGEWRLDSSSNRLFSYDRLVILADSSLYMFSGSDGGSLIATGRRLRNDSIMTDHYGDLAFALVDSNHLYLDGGWTNNENFYKRTESENYHDNLKQYLQQDSLRRKVIGWWKLMDAKMPVKLPNYSDYCIKFTLNIRPDGNAIFYLENKLDSTVDYSYNTNIDGIDFNRGCMVGSDSKTSFDAKGRMKLVLDRRMGDTLLLERITDIK